MIDCCIDCQEREVRPGYNCHMHCKRYLAAQKKNQMILDNKRREFAEHSIQIDSVKRRKKGK